MMNAGGFAGLSQKLANLDRKEGAGAPRERESFGVALSGSFRRLSSSRARVRTRRIILATYQ